MVSDSKLSRSLSTLLRIARSVVLPYRASRSEQDFVEENSKHWQGPAATTADCGGRPGRNRTQYAGLTAGKVPDRQDDRAEGECSGDHHLERGLSASQPRASGGKIIRRLALRLLVAAATPIRC